MITICGRRVKVQTGTKTQTVNICTAANRNGEYDYIIRLHPPFISEDTLVRQRFRSIADMVTCLQQEHHGSLERTPALAQQGASSGGGVLSGIMSLVGGQSRQMQRGAASSPRPSAQVAQPPLTPWEIEARSIVEQAIDGFIEDFLHFPYLHRVEHSVHCELYRIMSSHQLLGQTYAMGPWVSQVIHKEWPEWLPRPEKGNRRGNFDLCILSPDRLKSASFEEFRYGRIRPSIVIEVGLDYTLDHLRQDVDKLRNSGIADSYLIHLVRPQVADDFAAVERLVMESGIRTAYARVADQFAYYKLINDATIRTAELPLVRLPAA